MLKVVLIDDEGNVIELSDEIGEDIEVEGWNLDKSLPRNVLGSMIVEAIREALN